MATQNKAIIPEPQHIRFIAGGLASCTAELFTLPVDMAKVCTILNILTHITNHILLYFKW